MKNLLKYVFVSSLLSTVALATSNNLTPIIGFGSNMALNTTNAAAFNLQLSQKNYRVAGCYGFKIDPSGNQRFKMGLDLLWQRLNFNFIHIGNEKKWTNQINLNFAYQYILPNTSFIDHYDVATYISHTPHNNLSQKIIKSGNSPVIINRSLAGSSGIGSQVGITVHPWNGGYLGALLNYDRIMYKTKNSPGVHAIGFGNTVTLTQYLNQQFSIQALATKRKFIRALRAEIIWTKQISLGELHSGLYSAFNHGRHHLPDSNTIGVEFNFLLGKHTHQEKVSITSIREELRDWTSRQEIYIPQVLTIAD